MTRRGSSESSPPTAVLHRYAGALEYFEQVLAVAPAEVAGQVRLQCAWCHWQLGDGPRSEAIYSQVLEDDPVCWQALLDRARMYLGQGAWSEALPDLELVLHMGHANAETYNDRGVCYYELDDVSAALASFDEAIALNPDYAQSYTNRGNCNRRLALRDASKLESAETDYTKAVELDATNPKSYNNRGALLLKMSKYTEAFADFEQALALYPEYEVARRNLEVAREQRDKEVDGAAARANLYARRASGGEAMIYRNDRASMNERASVAAADGLPPPPPHAANRKASMEQLEQAMNGHHVTGRSSQAGVVTYTDGGSAGATALQVGEFKAVKEDEGGDAPMADGSAGHGRKSTAL